MKDLPAEGPAAKRIAALIESLPRKRKLVVNPKPLNVVEVRGQVPIGTSEWLRSLSRDQRRAIWVAIGGDPDEWDAEHPETDKS